MKANWKVALMCLAMVAFVVSCKPKNEPSNNDQQGGGGGTETPTDYKAPLDVKDNSVADWDALDQSKVAVATITPEPYWGGLKTLKVYADEVYIYYMLEYDPTAYKSHTSVDVMHFYFDMDNSDETGGFFDSFADAAADIMTEGPLYDDAGNALSYMPTPYKWNGNEGSSFQPSERDVKDWDADWEQAGNAIKGESQFVGENYIEGRLLVDLIPGTFAETFGFGVDLQQNWNNIGLLPQLDAQGTEGEFIGRTNMLKVTFNKIAK